MSVTTPHTSATVEECAQDLAHAWGVRQTAWDIGQQLSCAEVDALAKLLTAAGQRDLGATLIDSHAATDTDPEDWHQDTDAAHYLDQITGKTERVITLLAAWGPLAELFEYGWIEGRVRVAGRADQDLTLGGQWVTYLHVPAGQSPEQTVRGALQRLNSA